MNALPPGVAKKVANKRGWCTYITLSLPAFHHARRLNHAVPARRCRVRAIATERLQVPCDQLLGKMRMPEKPHCDESQSRLTVQAAAELLHHDRHVLLRDPDETDAEYAPPCSP